MTYTTTVYNVHGEHIANLSPTHTIAAARQAMLDHSDTIDLPAEAPLFLPDIGVLESWFVGRTEYVIRQTP